MTQTERPPARIRVGITGHRYSDERFGQEDAASVQAALANAFSDIAAAAANVLREAGWAYLSPSPGFALVSSLAEGADTLAAEAALAAGWDLEAVLPMPDQEYRQDFADAASGAAFDRLLARAGTVLAYAAAPPGAPRSHAYEAAGILMLDRVDLLVAVWDRGEGRGPGATTAVVAEAGRRCLPVWWIPPRPGAGSAGMLPMPGVAGCETLAGCIARLLAPPPRGAIGGCGGAAGDRLQAYLESDDRFAGGDPWGSGLYGRLLRALAAPGPGQGPALADTAAPRESPDWREFLAALPDAAGPGLGTVLHRRFSRADRHAARLGRTYRSAYVANFLLASLAVPVGLLSVFAWESLAAKAVAVGLELCCIGAIIVLTWAGRRGKWHARWLECRRLAEALRTTRLLLPLGLRAQSPLATVAGTPAAQGDWTAWYVRATVRAMPPPAGRLDARYLRQCLDAALVVVDDQVGYHRANAGALRQLHHRLDHLGEVLFRLAALAGLLFLIAAAAAWSRPAGDWLSGALKGWGKPLATWLAATLPALGAAVSGIRAQGDFDAFAERSEGTALRLQRLRAELAAERASPSLERTRALIIEAAEAMNADLDLWAAVYRHRPLTLPS